MDISQHERLTATHPSFVPPTSWLGIVTRRDRPSRMLMDDCGAVRAVMLPAIQDVRRALEDRGADLGFEPTLAATMTTVLELLGELRATNTDDYRTLVADLYERDNSMETTRTNSRAAAYEAAFLQGIECGTALAKQAETPLPNDPDLQQAHWPRRFLIAACLILTAGMAVLVYSTRPRTDPSLWPPRPIDPLPSGQALPQAMTPQPSPSAPAWVMPSLPEPATTIPATPTLPPSAPLPAPSVAHPSPVTPPRPAPPALRQGNHT